MSEPRHGIVHTGSWQSEIVSADETPEIAKIRKDLRFVLAHHKPAEKVRTFWHKGAFFRRRWTGEELVVR